MLAGNNIGCAKRPTWTLSTPRVLCRHVAGSVGGNAVRHFNRQEMAVSGLAAVLERLAEDSLRMARRGNLGGRPRGMNTGTWVLHLSFPQLPCVSSLSIPGSTLILAFLDLGESTWPDSRDSRRSQSLL